MRKDSKIFIAGHKGLVGSAILKRLEICGYKNIITRNRDKLNLLDQNAVEEFFKEVRPEYVVLAAAKVGGIIANNTYRADFIYENLQIQNNIIHQSYVYGVEKLLFLGSTCIYPKNAPQPMKEDCLLSSPLEYTNEPYAIAKIAGLKMCESYNLQHGTNFISVMPTNLYGPNDNFDLHTSHVLPALVRKIHLSKLLKNRDYDSVIHDLKVDSREEALKCLSQMGITQEKVTIWGSGNPRREFIHSSDMAEACIFLLENIDFSDILALGNHDCYQEASHHPHINIGSGVDISIGNLAELIKQIVGYDGELVFDLSKPDGTYRKLTDPTRLNKLGWKPTIGLEEGIQQVYSWYCSQNYTT
ncbi:GDP-L-fucose synthase [Vibrio sp. Of14-4]|uniref:GDP-L-fucose synthase family protein n=1 Tax=Vibrio sp. Of14-4 TaxID=2724878 RepID=UPI001EF19030|nr:GDP-L-fucose synthase [Vibrio sp. Of14-4]MCG7489649.1 GDP-L-fucose synthase [Vibrio sp. Of14-4]